MKRIILAFDSFKGSLSALELVEIAASTIEKYNALYNTSFEYLKFPISDGGEGFLDVMEIIFKDAKKYYEEVYNFNFEKISAPFLILEKDKKKIAIIESARIIGLHYFKKKEKKPFEYSTYGIGELINILKNKYLVDDIYIGLGGTATVDLGLGILEALEIAEFYDKNNSKISFVTPSKWDTIENVKLKPNSNLPNIHIFSDVKNTLFGEEGGLKVYSPQKGVEAAQLVTFIKKANRIVNLIDTFNVYQQPHTGAAGGIPWALLLLNKIFNKNITLIYDGIDKILELSNFDNIIKNYDILFTGEGATDYQSFYNKAVGKIIEIAQKNNLVPIVISGKIDVDPTKINAITFSICNGPLSLEEAMKNTKKLFEHKIINILKTIQYLG